MTHGHGLNRIRSRTAHLHRQLDDRLSVYDLADAQDYRHFLSIHASVLPAWENWLQRHIALAPSDMTPIFRAPLLHADICALTGHAPPAAPPSLPPLVASPAACMGVIYVLEGSRLGARILHKRVSGDLPLSYLADRRQMVDWRAFTHDLDQLPDNELDIAIDAAAALFQSFLETARATPLPDKAA